MNPPQKLTSLVALILCLAGAAPALAADARSPFMTPAELLPGCEGQGFRQDCRDELVTLSRIDREAFHACKNGQPAYHLDCAQTLNGHWFTPDVRRFCGAQRERSRCFYQFRDGVFDERLMQICADYGRDDIGRYESRCTDMIRGKVITRENQPSLLSCFAPGTESSSPSIARMDRLNCVALALTFTPVLRRYPSATGHPLPNEVPVP